MTYRYARQVWQKGVDQHMRDIGGDMVKGELPQEWEGMKKAGDLLPDPTKYGEYVKVRDIAGGPVKIVGIVDWSGAGDPTMGGRPGLLINADLVDGSKVWFIVSHQVLYRKLNDLRGCYPFLATFYKVDKKRYFDVK